MRPHSTWRTCISYYPVLYRCVDGPIEKATDETLYRPYNRIHDNLTQIKNTERPLTYLSPKRSFV